MRVLVYAIYGLVLAAISLVTKEVVTFIMLGFVLMALHNIHGTLKRILARLESGSKE